MTTPTDRTETRSAQLPTDPFEVTLSGLLGHPDGAHTGAAVVQAVDFYGKATQYILQTVKWPEGTSMFITQVNAEGSDRFVLPPKVVAVLLRQQDQVTTIARRRHGRRLAEAARANGQLRAGGFTPAMRKKALATRKAKAAKRAARRQRKGVA